MIETAEGIKVGNALVIPNLHISHDWRDLKRLSYVVFLSSFFSFVILFRVEHVVLLCTAKIVEVVFLLILR